MDTNPDKAHADRVSHRRRGPLALVVAAGLAVGLLVPLVQSTASALPPVCDDGSPPPCLPVDTEPSTIPPTTGPPPINWSARVSVLDQGDGGYSRTMWGGWHRSGSPSYVTPSGRVVWSNYAGTEGTLGLTQTYLPPGGVVGFEVHELGTDGPTCRSQPFGAVPPTGRSVHILVAPKITKSPADITAMVSGLTGRISPDPQGAQVTINSLALVPQNGGLQLTARGRIYKDVTGPFNYYGSFAYVIMLHLIPSRNPANTYEVMTVSADEGILQLRGDSAKDDALAVFGDNPEPSFRQAVKDKATAAINDDIAQRPEVGWFRSLGYAVSVRRVTTTPNGIEVLPSLCKVD